MKEEVNGEKRSEVETKDGRGEMEKQGGKGMGNGERGERKAERGSELM